MSNETLNEEPGTTVTASAEVKAVVEALIFASPEPMTPIFSMAAFLRSLRRGKPRGGPRPTL